MQTGLEIAQVLLALLGACLAGVLGVLVLRAGMRAHARKTLNQRYPGARGLIDRNVGVRRARRNEADGFYALAFPTWAHATKRGTADQRFVDNQLVWHRSVARVDEYVLTLRDPAATIGLVAHLRANGAAIAPCELELTKGQRLVAQTRAVQALARADAIARYFAQNPAGFEEYCASILRGLGFEAATTPATGDGGYDIAFRKDGLAGLAECKCYAVDHTVSRPLIQKLVGANQTVGADLLFFITTSSFSRGALDYARETGVDCIDGARLLELRAQTGMAALPPVRFDDVAWQLTLEDIAPYYPADAMQTSGARPTKGRRAPRAL